MAKVITQTKLAKLQNRYSERVLHVPSDLAVIVAAISALASASVVVLVIAAIVIGLGLVVFSA